MQQAKAKIVHNKRIKGPYWHCIIEAPLIAGESKPGQFLNIRVSAGLSPLLRRPFSIHDVRAGRLGILYEVVGEGSRIFSDKKVGEHTDIIGPLGSGFDYSQINKRQENQPILVGGGIGVAPLLFLAKAINSENKTILLGAKCREQVLCEKEFKKAGCSVKITTDDGSLGFKGRVTDLLSKALQVKMPKGKKAMIYACGPRPMIRAVCSLAIKYNIPAQVSLEEHMSCGIGACLGCVVSTRRGLERVCKEGPVFNAKDLIWGANES